MNKAITINGNKFAIERIYNVEYKIKSNILQLSNLYEVNQAIIM